MPARAQTLKTGSFGPPLGGGRRRHPGTLSWGRLAGFVGALLLVSLVSATVTAAALVWYGQRQITRVDVETRVPGDSDGDGSVDIPELRDLRNVLVVGSDSREGLSPRERRELATGNFAGTRTDTIMLVQLDPDRHGAAMLSFPRDLLVTRCDGTEGRINAAYEIGESSGLGGPTCLVRTVSEYSGIPIHHYVEVNFAGFVDVVDALGGVTMYLEEPIVDREAKVDLPRGCVSLTGAEALGFVRTRKIDNDFGRIARQQRFIREIVDQLTSASVALNVPRLFELVEAGARAVDTDPGLSLNLMRRIAFSFRDITSEQIDARTVPGFNRLISGAAYVVADPEPTEALFAAFRNGVAAPRDVGTESPSDVAIEDVPPLTVLNATQIPGLAAEVGQALEAMGFQIAGMDNADDQDATRTRILHPPERREEADLIAELFPQATLQPQEGDGFVIEVGPEVDPEVLLAEAEEAMTRAAPPSPAPEPTYAGAAPVDDPGC